MIRRDGHPKLPTLRTQLNNNNSKLLHSSSSPIKQPQPHHNQQEEEEDRQLRIESSDTANTNNSGQSFRIYYGGVSVAIPFVWESKPGTPKHTSQTSDSNSLLTPPLTPPPSYYRQSPDYTTTDKSLVRRSSRSSLVPEFCKRIISIRHKRKPQRRSLTTVYDLAVHHDEEEVNSSPNSTLCFWR